MIDNARHRLGPLARGSAVAATATAPAGACQGNMESSMPQSLPGGKAAFAMQAHATTSQREVERAERMLARIILPASCTMIGVCATFVGLVKIVEAKLGHPGHVDQYSSLVILLFLGSAGASYLAVRHSARRRFSAHCELIADVCFLAGLFAIAMIAVFFAHEII